ncbi:GH21338 [Drosophila grimshawi]|uniref:GH21338 n=1 Tax=Drosophila grimshawi TaxID=7222 RepID=B4J8J7_DROGR|nr:GH21338 [Drosophila grimshawi]
MAASPKHAPPTFTLLTLNPQAQSPAVAVVASKQNNSKRIASLDATYSTPTPTPSQLDAIAVAQPNSDIDSTNDSTSFASALDTSLTPPKHASSTTTGDSHAADVTVEVEQAELIPVHQKPEEKSGTLPDYLLELQQKDKDVGGPVPWTPAPNGAPLSVIAWDLLPPLETAPQNEPIIITEQQPTKHVIGVEQPGSHNIRVSLSSGQGLSPQAPAPLTPGVVSVVSLGQDGPEAHGTNAHVGTTTPSNPGRFASRNRGNVHYSTTTTTPRPRSTTTATTTTTTTTTTPKPTTTTTTRRTTTTTRPTTRRTTTTTKRTTTTPRPARSTTPLDPSTLYKLDNEEAYAYTLPPWLQDVTDPDLDVAVTFIVPTDNDQYNHTLADDLEPPFEPFVDLNNLQLTPPPTSERPSTTTKATIKATTTTTTTTTTKRPSVAALPTAAPSTARPTQAPHIFRAHTTQRQQQQQEKEPLITTTTPKPTAPPKSTPAVPVETNPFDSSTLPSWLKDFDYPDVGPGVPYNPDNFKDSADEGVQKPGGTPAVIDSSAFPSKVTLTLPASNDGTELNTVEPPLVLIPPIVLTNSDNNEQQPQQEQPTSLDTRSGSKSSTTNSITHFPARFDPPPSQSSATTSTKPEPQQFPPGNGNPVDGQKVEYSKSDDGKVISTPLNTQRNDVQGSSVHQGSSTASFGSAAPTAATAASNTGKYTGGFGAPAGLLRPLSSSKPDIYVAGNKHEFNIDREKNRRQQQSGNTGRYTGGFGAPDGVLSPQNAPRPFQPTQQTQQSQQPSRSLSNQHSVGAASSHNQHRQNRFGGPPGILVPFDNVQRTGGQ